MKIRKCINVTIGTHPKYRKKREREREHVDPNVFENISVSISPGAKLLFSPKKQACEQYRFESAKRLRRVGKISDSE